MKRMNKLSNMESCERVDSKSIFSKSFLFINIWQNDIDKLLSMDEVDEKDLEEKVPAIISDIDQDSLLGFNLDSVFEGEMIQKKSKAEKHKPILFKGNFILKIRINIF